MLEEFEDYAQKSEINPNNIFEKIWTSPRAVFKFINDYKFDRYFTLLIVLSGISRTFDRAAMKNLGDEYSLGGVISYCIIVGALLGWVSYYLYAALISWTGNWLGGKGNTHSIIRVLAYSLVPSILSMFLLIPQIMIYGNGIFQSDGDVVSAGIIGNILFYGSLILELTLGIWSFLLCVIGISEVQKLSIGKSILNLLLPAILFIVIILIFVILFWPK